MCGRVMRKLHVVAEMKGMREDFIIEIAFEEEERSP
jgi:hypothetical protein